MAIDKKSWKRNLADVVKQAVEKSYPPSLVRVTKPDDNNVLVTVHPSEGTSEYFSIKVTHLA